MEAFLQLSQTIAESPDLNPQECRSWDRLFAPPGKPAQAPHSGKYEAEDATFVKLVGTPRGRAVRQDMADRKQQWSGDAHLFWRCPSPDLQIRLLFDVSDLASGSMASRSVRRSICTPTRPGCSIIR